MKRQNELLIFRAAENIHVFTKKKTKLNKAV